MTSSGTGASGRRLGRYHLAEPLGGGPTGEVFRAKVYGVAGFERQFAVKRFHPDFVKDPSIAAEIASAARTYGSLEHPRIARLHEYGVAGGETFTATELIHGVDLGRLIVATYGAGEPLLAGAATSLMSQAARAVGHAHGRNVCHLGLCPTNLICTADGDVKITDFGFLPPRLPEQPASDYSLAARIPYLAPEQLVGEQTSAATDVFQLGVIAYEVLTGERAFSGPTPLDISHQILSGQPPEPALPKPLLRVLQRCLARSPFERFPDARALADALDAAVRATPLPGGRREVGAAVRSAVDRLAQMHDQQVSGALSFPVPAPPAARGAAPPRAQGSPLPTPPAGGRTVLGIGAPALPTDLRADTEIDERPTAIHDRPQGFVSVPTAPTSVPARIAPPSIQAAVGPGGPPARNGTRAAPPTNGVAEPALPPARVTEPGVAMPPPVPPASNGPRASQPVAVAPAAPPPVPPDSAAPAGEAGSFRFPSETPPPIVEAPAPHVMTLPASAPSPSAMPAPLLASPPARRNVPRAAIWATAAVLVSAAGIGGYFAYASSGSGDPDPARAQSVVSDDAGSALAAVEPGATKSAAEEPAAEDPAVDEPAVEEPAAAPAIDAPPPTLEIVTRPAGAKIYLDGTLIGKSPQTLDATSDKHQMALILPSHKLYTAEIDGTGQVEVDLEEVTPTGGPAGIKVRCHHKNRYYVIVDGKDVGQLCPTERIGVDLGEHVVEIYDPETESRREFNVRVKETRLSLRVRVD